MRRVESFISKSQEPHEARIKEFENQLVALTPEEASKDLDALTEIGHEEICILAGEELAPGPDKAIKSTHDPDELVRYLQLAVDKPGIKEVILNIGSYSENIFRYLKDNLHLPAGVKLQHRVFQESYDKKEYDYYMRRCPGYKGTKRDWEFRYNSQVAALKAGFDEVGIGALFGLTRYPLKEIVGLQEHAAYIQEKGGKEPKRCCLPLGNDPEPSENPVEIKYFIPDREGKEKIIELIYALARLAMPTISIVSSERDRPEILENLDKYANHTTLFVHPAPGENIKSLEELKTGETEKRLKPIAQAETFSRRPAKALKSWEKRGYNVLDFNTKKYDI